MLSTVYFCYIANAVSYMVPGLHKHLNALLCRKAAAAAAAAGGFECLRYCCCCSFSKCLMQWAPQTLLLRQDTSLCSLRCVQAGVDADGHPHVMGFPVKELKGDFPLRPECMGNLVPQQINLWMGAAPKGHLLYNPCHSLLNKKECLDSGLLTVSLTGKQL